MFENLKNSTVPITIGVSFYIFGFFVMSTALNLSEREIVIGLVAGGIGGITTLVAMLWPEQKRSQPPHPASVS
jgi:hypothetical protein